MKVLSTFYVVATSHPSGRPLGVHMRVSFERLGLYSQNFQRLTPLIFVKLRAPDISRAYLAVSPLFLRLVEKRVEN